MALTLTYEEFTALKPCQDANKRISALFGGAKKWGKRAICIAEAHAAGCSFDDLVWASAAVSRKDKDAERRLRLWIADLAAHVLHIYEETGKSNAPRNAIIASRLFARGEISNAARASAEDAAWRAAEAAARASEAAAAGDAAWDAAEAAARASEAAAAGDVAWAAARRAAWAAARSAAGDVAWAAARRAAWAAARDAEEAWQYDRLVARMSNPEPEDWPLPALAG
jgi:hypothetical protein